MLYNRYGCDSMDFINQVIDFLQTMGPTGIFIDLLLTVFISIIPVVPLAVFITFNFFIFGNILGFIINYILTFIGCLISYYICYHKLGNLFQNNSKVQKLLNKFNNISFPSLVTIIAMPFSPAYLINIVAGMTKMDKKKFIYSIAIGKIFLIIFWGFIGTSITEIFQNPYQLIKVLILLISAYIISSIIKKKFDI